MPVVGLGRMWNCCATIAIMPGKIGQLEVIADGERIAERGGNWFTRSFGAGYPDLDSVVEQLEKHRANDAAR
jgi:hypothetical protein